MPETGAERSRPRRGRLWRNLLVGAFFVVVAALLVRYARGIEWSQVMASLGAYRAGTLATAIGLAATSFALFGAFDLFGRRMVGHGVPAFRSWAIGAVSYAFNLNLGAMLGGFGMRLRLYSRHGLETGTIARTIAVGVSTNWLGYLALAGVAFASGRVDVPPEWRIDGAALRLVGLAMLAAFAAVLVACARSRRRTWTLRGQDFTLPPLRIALVQAAVSTANWLAIATLMYVLLAGRVPLPTVTAVMLTAAIAGVVTHVPAGLGVLETVFVVLLGDRIPPHELIAALLAYRAIYYLLPLIVALVAWPLLESSASPAASTAPVAPDPANP
jgi:uncharacterized membrane protein YbhN (UPF0104 family)